MYRVHGAIDCARRVQSIFFVRGIGNELPADAIHLVPTNTVESILVNYYTYPYPQYLVPAKMAYNQSHIS